MRYLIPVMILFSLTIPSVTTAQAPSNEWDIGWESDDEVEIMVLDTSYNFNLVIEFGLTIRVQFLLTSNL